MDEDVRRQRLQAMGVTVWRSRVIDHSPATTAIAGRAAVDAESQMPILGPIDRASDAGVGRIGETSIDGGASLDQINEQNGSTLAVDLKQLQAQVSACTQCELHRSRKQTVFGVGDESARLLIIGEAPGADEDARGEPFVGRAGKLMNAMLAAIGLAREQVYIANILKCRPPGNRDPHADEVASCAHYLQQQIAFVAPELILAVGRIAAQSLLGVSTPIGKMRGTVHTHDASGTPVLVTYHPAYLLRSPLEKRRAWQDLKQVAARLGLVS